jgi:hypothetical protein
MDATTTTTNSASSLGDIGEQKPAQQADFYNPAAATEFVLTKVTKMGICQKQATINSGVRRCLVT